MKMGNYKAIVLSVLFGVLMVAGLFLTMGANIQLARADVETIFVAPGGGGDCSQAWPCSLQTALDSTWDGDTLYLSDGMYTGSGGAVITVTESITIYGGWDGTTAIPLVVDPEKYPTVINAESERRGVYVGESITVTLQGFTVTNGVHDYKGAGLYARNASLTLSNMSIYSNVIDTTATNNAKGGGAMIERGTVEVTDSIFSSNSVKSQSSPSGGGLFISNTLSASVVNNLFIYNDAWHASGLYFYAPYILNRPINVCNNVFVENGWGYSPGDAGGGYHGAIEIINGIAQIENNYIKHNYFGNGRGAVAAFDSDVFLNGNWIVDNVSSYDASAVYFNGLSSPFTMTNNIIAGNQSEYWWDEHFAVHIKNSYGDMSHNTIARNTSYYGIFLENSSLVTLKNTILVSHTVGISIAETSQAYLDNTLWGSGAWANDLNWGGAGHIFTGTVNIYAAPKFVDYEMGDYHIKSDSAAVDAGMDAGVDDDIDFDPRPFDGDGNKQAEYDIGADEYWPYYVYLPLVIK